MKKNLLFATRNPSKSSLIGKLLSPLGLDLLSLLDFPEIEETPEVGDSLEAIAINKAQIGYSSTGLPSFAIDTGLHIPSLSDSEQPGIFVRRFLKDSIEQSDEKMFAHFQALFGEIGEEIAGTWTSAIAFVDREDQVEAASFSSLTLFVSEASAKQSPGEPLNSFQYYKPLKTYFSEMSIEDRIIAMAERSLGIYDFIETQLRAL